MRSTEELDEFRREVFETCRTVKIPENMGVIILTVEFDKLNRPVAIYDDGSICPGGRRRIIEFLSRSFFAKELTDGEHQSIRELSVNNGVITDLNADIKPEDVN